MASPGVIISTKFVTHHSSGFNSYLDYMSRSEAVRTKAYNQYNFAFDDLKNSDFSAYNNYMSNPEKTSALFNNRTNSLKGKELDEVISKFKQAENNQSLMWQHVISFDNKWLEKYGKYDKKTHELDSNAVMQATREAMDNLMKEAGLTGAVWTGAIHYNTDNIHVHVAMVEPHPTREKYYYKNKDGSHIIDKKTNQPLWAYKGKLKKEYFEHVKSKIVSGITDQSEMLKELTDISRKEIGNKEKLLLAISNDKVLMNKYNDIQKALPDDRRLWKYNNNAMKEIRPLIDDFSFYYLSKYKPQELKQLDKKLDEAVAFYKSAYGESRYDDFKNNKIKDLYSQMGNTVLKDMLSKDRQFHQNNNSSHDKSNFYNNAQRNRPHRLTRRNIRHLNDAFEKTYDELHNEYEYKKMQREIEFENNNNLNM